MGVQETISAVLAEMTPEYVGALVRSLAAAQTAADRTTVSVAALVQALVKGEDLGTGSERWRALARLEMAIRDRLPLVPHMRYIEGVT